MPETEVVFCQRMSCMGENCEHFTRCNHHMYRKEKPEPEFRTCPVCGFTNPREAQDCEKCDWPLVF